MKVSIVTVVFNSVSNFVLSSISTVAINYNVFKTCILLIYNTQYSLFKIKTWR